MSDISNFVQRSTDTMLGQSNVSPVSHGPCAQLTTFCNDAALHGFRRHRFGTFVCRRVLSWPPFGGVCPFAPLPAGSRRLLWPPLFDRRLVTCLWTCKCNQLHGLCYKKGFFHGMQHSYRYSILTWMQPALEHCDPPDLHRDHGFATLWGGRWSLVIMKQSPFEAFLETLLERRPALPCFSFEKSGPLIVISFRFTCLT